VSIVPGIVIDEDSSVAHAGDLVSVVPPGKDLGILLGVHLQPVVGLAEVVNDDTGAIIASARQNDGR
jgi:hypothetical protein